VPAHEQKPLLNKCALKLFNCKYKHIPSMAGLAAACCMDEPGAKVCFEECLEMLEDESAEIRDVTGR
jgi:hypothetical protein